MSMFSGKRALRTQFNKITAATIATATDLATSQLLLTFSNWGRLAFLDNTLTDAGENPIDVAIYACHPEADPTDDANKILWFELPGLRVINYSVGGAPGISFDPGTRLYVHVVSGTPAAGALRVAVW